MVPRALSTVGERSFGCGATGCFLSTAALWPVSDGLAETRERKGAGL
jgi:hypothetical protein